MNKHPLTMGTLLLLSTMLTACDRNEAETSLSIPALVKSAQAGTARAGESGKDGIIELEWDALIPSDWQPDKLMEQYDANNLSDDDPRAQELMEKLKTFWNEAPVVHDYDGRIVKLPGFVVPVEMNAQTIQEFLLVPYYGACIHVPPPPANQTVHVVTDKDHPYRGELFDTVWVTGTLKVEKISSDLGDAGYRIEATRVEPYE